VERFIIIPLGAHILRPWMKTYAHVQYITVTVHSSKLWLLYADISLLKLFQIRTERRVTIIQAKQTCTFNCSSQAKLWGKQARNQWGLRPPLEKCVGHNLKTLDIVQKFWAPLGKLFAPPGVPSWLRAWGEVIRRKQAKISLTMSMVTSKKLQNE